MGLRNSLCALVVSVLVVMTVPLVAQSAGASGASDTKVTGKSERREASITQSPSQGTESKQRVDPKLPDAPSETSRLTTHQKFETFVRRTYSPYTFASAAMNATWAQMWGDWYGYGGGMQGWSKRFGASLANTEVRSALSSFLLPVVFKQDPRYHASGKKGLFPRAWYAGTRVLVTRSDEGNPMFNYSEVLGVLFTASIQNSYYPRRERGFDETFQRFTGGLSSDATSDLLREFTPEIKRAARKIIPKKAQKLEKKLPQPVRNIGIQMAQ